MKEISKSKGRYSIERIFQLCFMQKKVLSLEFFNPVIFKGKKESQLCVLEIAETDEKAEELYRRVAFRIGNSDGILRVKAYKDNPHDYEIISIDNQNIDEIENY